MLTVLWIPVVTSEAIVDILFHEVKKVFSSNLYSHEMDYEAFHRILNSMLEIE